MTLTNSSKTDILQVHRKNLKLMAEAKRTTLEKRKSEFSKAIQDAADLCNMPDYNMMWAWFQPLISNLDEEEDAKQFAKMLLFIYRLYKQSSELEKEISAVDMLLDEKGPLGLATVSFDDLEVLDDTD
jgi:predicted ATP-binding protein involved in virulence